MTGSYDVNGYIGYQAVATSIVFVGIAGAFVAARLVVRLGIIHNAGPDDWVILASVVSSAALSMLIYIEDHHGLGRHIETISHPDYVTFLKLVWVGAPMYNVSLILTKISILLLYLRVFPGKPFRRACWIMLVFVTAYGLWIVIATIMSCYPIPYSWDKTIQGGHCQNKMALWFCIAALRIATDLAIFALPMPLLASLQLPRKQRFLLMLVFAVGGFVCMTSFLRLYHLYVLAKSKDFAWDNVQAITWSSIEINVGIICACLPTLRPLIRSCFPRLLASSTSRQVSQFPPSAQPLVNPDREHAGEEKPSIDSSRNPEVRVPLKEENEKQGNRRLSRGLQDFELEVLSLSTRSTSRGVTPAASA